MTLKSPSFDMLPDYLFNTHHGKTRMPPKILIVGSGGREASFAAHLVNDSSVYAYMSSANTLIIDCVKYSGGRYEMGDICDPESVAGFAARYGVDLVFVSSDAPLAAGVVDAVMKKGIRVVGPKRNAAKIEWDKIFSIKMAQKVAPQNTPFFIPVENADDLPEAIDAFIKRDMDIVVKPRGLTGGKGVKVMPIHLAGYEECREYATSILRSGDSILLVERIDGIEFTIMGITDGKTLIMSPASYDYPFRYPGDTGPGTGGMGCFVGPERNLPFMDDSDYDTCRKIMQGVIDEMSATGLHFNGVLNGGFFKTLSGIVFMEFNGRFGDPEGMAVLSVLSGPLSRVLEDIDAQRLSQRPVAFSGMASVVKYMVAKEYPLVSPEPVRFEMDEEAIKKKGVRAYFAACKKVGPHTYSSMPGTSSRIVAFCATADTIQSASQKIDDIIKRHVNGPNLEYRQDIGSTEYVRSLVERAESMSPKNII